MPPRTPVIARPRALHGGGHFGWYGNLIHFSVHDTFATFMDSAHTVWVVGCNNNTTLVDDIRIGPRNGLNIGDYFMGQFWFDSKCAFQGIFSNTISMKLVGDFVNVTAAGGRLNTLGFSWGAWRCTTCPEGQGCSTPPPEPTLTRSACLRLGREVAWRAKWLNALGFSWGAWRCTTCPVGQGYYR